MALLLTSCLGRGRDHPPVELQASPGSASDYLATVTATGCWPPTPEPNWADSTVVAAATQWATVNAGSPTYAVSPICGAPAVSGETDATVDVPALQTSDDQYVRQFMGGSVVLTASVVLPAGARIDTVTVTVEAHAQDPNRLQLASVSLGDGSSSGSGWIIPTTDSTTAVTVAAVSLPATFPVVLHVNYIGPAGNNSTVYVDSVQVHVTYEPGG